MNAWKNSAANRSRHCSKVRLPPTAAPQQSPLPLYGSVTRQDRSKRSRVDWYVGRQYPYGMTSQQLTMEAMALPLADRVSLAQALWQSIDAGLPEISEADAVRESIRRDLELSSGAVVGRTHVEVMQAARRAIECV